MNAPLSFKVPTMLAGLLLVLSAGLTSAQQVYRHVGPDGRVTFSDKPITPSSQAHAESVTGAASAAPDPGNANWPYELRQTASKYPVVLYTSANCGPCQAARSLLIQRGVPFTEKTISTTQDAQALQRLSGDGAVPYATVGGQGLRGFSDIEWTRMLDAAGYAATSQLPRNYRPPTPTPLVAIQAPLTADEPPQTAAPPVAPKTPAVPARPAQNPAGIRF